MDGGWGAGRGGWQAGSGKEWVAGRGLAGVGGEWRLGRSGLKGGEEGVGGGNGRKVWWQVVAVKGLLAIGRPEAAAGGSGTGRSGWRVVRRERLGG